MFLTDGAPHFVICVQLEETRTIGIIVNFSVAVWQRPYSQGSHETFVVSKVMLHSKQLQLQLQLHWHIVCKDFVFFFRGAVITMLGYSRAVFGTGSSNLGIMRD